MFEYPKTQASENLKEDVQEIRRWLSRFVPELEQQLADISTDNFLTISVFPSRGGSRIRSLLCSGARIVMQVPSVRIFLL